jgi:hypothetical protein
MRVDVFSGLSQHSGTQTPRVEIEKCDRCGAVAPLFDISFTGSKFLCSKCLANAA